MINQIEIGQYLQKTRKGLGLTQKDVAERLGISYQAVSKWENGETLPDAGLLLPLADLLNTTTDKILSGGTLIIRKGRRINVANVVTGIESLVNLKQLLGEKNLFYRGAIEGINHKMNIDFEELVKSPSQKEFLIGEAIMQYLSDGYTLDYEELEPYLKSEKLKKLIKKYMGEPVRFDKLTIDNNPALFDQIRSIRPEFHNLDELTLLPGEYIRMESNKEYWCSQIETGTELCLGLAVDEVSIKVFEYGAGGENQRLIHEEKRND
ncbi:MAG: helix-turn-helix transcriptional regulator [Bacilli bacterium]|jgi:transcriptional regulator with XRE-family HTH domain